MAARFNFGTKDEPNYNPYGSVFTERQQAIINGENISGLTKGEVVRLIRKAEKMGSYYVAEKVFFLYETLLTSEKDLSTLSQAEKAQIVSDCKERLQKLTPWALDW